MISPDELRRVVPALSDLPDAMSRRIAEMAVERRYHRGANLYRTGDRANGLYILLSGRVRVARETAGRSIKRAPGLIHAVQGYLLGRPSALNVVASESARELAA